MNQTLLRSYAAKLTQTRRAGLTNAQKRRTPPASRAEASAEIAATAYRVAEAVARDYVFGYHTREDIVQEGVCFALEALEAGKYDVGRPLENFLHYVIRSRLFNFVRDNFRRVEAPCGCCDPFDPPPEPCRRWVEWNRRNEAKQNIMRPLDVDGVSDEGERNLRREDRVAEEASLRETLGRIDEGLPVDLRGDYLRMRAGAAVPKGRRQKVREAVLLILTETGA